MANTFKNALRANIGTTATTIYTAPAGNTSICIELDISNLVTSTVSANVIVVDSSASNTAYIVKNVPIPTGSALQVIAGQKIVLEAGDFIQVQSDTASSLDAVAAILEGV